MNTIRDERASGRALWFVLPICIVAVAVGVQEASAQVGACCLGNATCIITEPSGCDAVAGEYLGDGTTCAAAICTGACCLPAETCNEGSHDDCVSGDFQGAGSTCDTHCAGALGTGLTYQGQIKQNGTPLTGAIDLKASLWVAAIEGDQVGGVLALSEVQVTNGLFTVNLDFGAGAFGGDKRWLELSVRSPHDPGDTRPFTTVSPRQPVTAAPHALFSSAPWQTSGTDISYNAGNVGIGTTEPDDRLHVRGTQPTLRLDDDGAPGSFSEIKDAGPIQLRINKTNKGGSVLLDFNPKVIDGTSDAQIRFFRETDTTGPKTVQFLRGNFSTQASARIGVDGADSFFQAHGGNLGIGTSNPNFRLHVVGDGGVTIQAENLAVTGVGIVGTASGACSVGVWGFVGGTGVVNYGFLGGSASTTGYDFFANGAGQNYGASSSRRWKRNIENIDQPLEKIARLRGVYFDWDKEHGGHHDVGMIAEEVGAVLPEIVVFEENGIDAHGMDYSKLTPLLVEAVNALRVEKDAEIAELHTEKDREIAELGQRIAELERLVERLVSTGEELTE